MAAAGYYAPSYFSPSYFYIAINPTASPLPTGVSPYDAPTYFPPSYFYGGASPTLIVVVAETMGRDEATYAALLALVAATGAFEEVVFGAATQRNQSGADGYPLAVVTPREWEEFDDYDPTSILRRVSFGITIVVKSHDGNLQFDRLDRLSTAILNVIDGSDLNGSCVPPLTRIRAGRYDFSTHYPEQSIELVGEFSSILPTLS